MSTIRANTITNSAGTGAPDFPNGLTDNSNAVLNSASSLPAANLTGNLPALNASSLTNLPAANLTGTLPAIDGSSLTNLPGSVTHLGTITTTTGSSQTLSGLDLTGYKQLLLFVAAVSVSSTGILRFGTSANNNNRFASQSTASGDYFWGSITVDLVSGVFGGSVTMGSSSSASVSSSTFSGPSGLSNASTSVTVSTSGGSFDAGSIRIYGVK